MRVTAEHLAEVAPPLKVVTLDRYEVRWRELPRGMEGTWHGQTEVARSGDPLRHTYVRVPCLYQGDYAGVGLVGESNVRSWEREFPGTYIVQYSGYGYRAILVRLSAYLIREDVRRAVDGLCEYPLLDEDDHSDLEMERGGEWLETDGLRDLWRSLVRLGMVSDDTEYTDQWVATLWRETSDRYGVYVEARGGFMWANMERLAARITVSDLDEAGYRAPESDGEGGTDVADQP